MIRHIDFYSMKKTINGEIYDTDTAELLVDKEDWGNDAGGIYGADFYLFRTKDGRYFEYGKGGAGTRFGRYVGHNSRIGGEMITPLDEDGAKDWVVKYGTKEDFSRIFGGSMVEFIKSYYNDFMAGLYLSGED